ncbi:fatty acid oxidation complex subunit alpha FadB [Photobacterium rosenbergii]|uniref:enoyl-CoA hydratase n=1 Tax=Photobacterium rosenbergii TaxID=294936 RepID=A0ABU3ZNT2_9GAMM|nr:fatty acid oxidation complex subunit alpha FadB [Photobacterium rosenbergii]MDV5171767.1 fatty acid oxidation complex subunit alpha FadB [Photobacterium rosenbergii]
MYQGQHFQVAKRGQFADLIFDAQESPVNILSKEALQDLEQCVEVIRQSDCRGLMIRSNKRGFSGGANVKAFRELFKGDTSVLEEYITWVHSIYNGLEDLPMPKVVVMNNSVVGGSLELALLADYRLATEDARLNFPEVKLGILPGWGGVTRMPRIVGLDTALAWTTTGKNYRAEQALKDGVVDGIIAADQDPIAQAEALLESCINGDLDWKGRYQEKQAPLMLNDYEVGMSINVAKGMVAKAAGKHYPAPHIIVDALHKSAKLSRDEAIAVELQAFLKCATSGVADALVSVLLNDLDVKAKTKNIIKGAESAQEVGVIGAGIMGGGVAYVTADKGMDVVLKDINKAGLALGLDEANSLLSKQVERRRKTPKAMGDTLNRIQPTLHNESLQATDMIIEAVVENPKVKEVVLAELEQVAPNAVIASNTSTLMISGLAQALKKPENFCGIHFFNPVPKMPLVEVIRGEKTSDETIQRAVKYVAQLGKTPIVVNDCAGFLVNRCLAPYFHAFNQLVVDGGHIPTIDKVMSKEFGWPMGPAYLLDVIGLDTAAHCLDVMEEAFPGRMTKPEKNLIQAMVDLDHYGQKNKQGFFTHTPDRKGRLKPSGNEAADQLVASMAAPAQEFTADDITMRMMLPMMFEAIRCLDEGIVATPGEADIAMIYGTGFPPFRGGIFYYMDLIGLDKLLEASEKYAHLGELYQAPASLVARVENNEKFYA